MQNKMLCNLKSSPQFVQYLPQFEIKAAFYWSVNALVLSLKNYILFQFLPRTYKQRQTSEKLKQTKKTRKVLHMKSVIMVENDVGRCNFQSYAVNTLPLLHTVLLLLVSYLKTYGQGKAQKWFNAVLYLVW